MPPVLLVYTSIRYRLPRFSPKTILYHAAVKIQLPPPGGDGATRRVADPSVGGAFFGLGFPCKGAPLHGEGGAAKRLRLRACPEAKDVQLATTQSVPDPERKSACYRIPRPSNHTAGYRIPQGRTDMRFRATQLGRRLQRGHTLQRRCYVAAHSTQGTSRTPSPTKRLRGAADLYLLPNGAVREASLRMSVLKYPLTKFPFPVC